MPRLAAWEVLQAVSAGAYADSAVERIFGKYLLITVDKSLAMEIAYGSIRKRYWLDCWIDFLGKVPSLKQPPLLRWLLHIGLYQIFCMEKIPASAIVNTSVELAKSKKLGRLALVVNGILRSAVRYKNAGVELPKPKDPLLRLSQEYSIPKWLAEKLIIWRGLEGAECVANAFNRIPSIDIRVNTLCSSLEDVKRSFESAGYLVDHIDDSNSALHILNGSGDVENWPDFNNGYWCVQDRAAQWITTLLSPNAGERVLDACAAPGGKATHIAQLMGDHGEIWAVDRSVHRLKLAEKNSKRLGISTINFLVADATCLLEIKPHWRSYFDRILIDAPCSGLGTLSRHPDARWRMTPEKIEELVSLQANILDGVLPLLKVGGSLVYATCTIHPEENSHQIHTLINRKPELFLRKEYQLWPDSKHYGDGFYAAILSL